MADALDDLFDGGQSATPRSKSIRALLFSGLTLAVLGMACTTVPGGALVLVSWAMTDTEQKRLASGFLPASYEKEVASLQRQTFVGVCAVLGLFALQIALLCSGFYNEFWLQALLTLSSFLPEA